MASGGVYTAVNVEEQQDDVVSLLSSSSSKEFDSSDSPSPPTSPTVRIRRAETKYPLIKEGVILMCRLNPTRTIISKIVNSKFFRKWENHHLTLGANDIHSSKPSGFMEESVPYSVIGDIKFISRWDAGHKFCLRLPIPDGSLLLQACDADVRDQWMHSIQWKKNVYAYDKLLKSAESGDVLVKEVKNMVSMVLSMCVQDQSIFVFPLELVLELLKSKEELLTNESREEIIMSVAPLLEKNNPMREIYEFFTRNYRKNPRLETMTQLYLPVVQRVLKHNSDFGKYKRALSFLMQYLEALCRLPNPQQMIVDFAKTIHGPSSSCPHLRVLPNILAVCLAGIRSYFDKTKLLTTSNDHHHQSIKEHDDCKFQTYVTLLNAISEYEDWRKTLAAILQPIPFPEEAIANEQFTKRIVPTIRSIADDSSCEVHTLVLGLRSDKDGWFDLYCPGGAACNDDGELFLEMLSRLMGCCCRRKGFLQHMEKIINPCVLLALRNHLVAMDTLLAMLEFEVVSNIDVKMQIITTLQSTVQGKQMYAVLCERQIQLYELQQRGGPKKLILPSKATNDDLSKMLSSGSFGNLECLSLAFTQVTSACAKDLIKLPSLKYLNLWSTRFGDAGLQLLAEHLQNLRVLNLCETHVTDKGLSCLAGMKSLHTLNLNSTRLTSSTWELLKKQLPALQHSDICYTDAF